MGPRKSAKRKAVAQDVEPEPTQFDASRFLSLDHFKRFKKIEGRNLLAERKVKLSRFNCAIVTRQIAKRKWSKLADPLRPNQALVREFYANAFLHPAAAPTYQTFVRGKYISFSAVAINKVLGTTLTGPDAYRSWMENIDYDEILRVVGTSDAEYHPPTTRQHILRKHLSMEAQVFTTFIHSNISPVSHTSDITEQRYHILFCLMTDRSLDIGFHLSQTILASARSTGQGPLHLPGLITLLCQSAGLDITQGLRQKLRLPIDDGYVRRHCQLEPIADPTSQPPSSRPSSSAPPAPPSGPRTRQRPAYVHRDEFQEAMQRASLERQALYRSQTFLMDSMRTLSLHIPGASPTFPSAAAYTEYVAWPQYPGDQDTSAGGDSAAAADADEPEDTEPFIEEEEDDDDEDDSLDQRMAEAIQDISSDDDDEEDTDDEE